MDIGVVIKKYRKEAGMTQEEMANRSRTNPVQFCLSDDEQYILTAKFNLINQ